MWQIKLETWTWNLKCGKSRKYMNVACYSPFRTLERCLQASVWNCDSRYPCFVFPHVCFPGESSHTWQVVSYLVTRMRCCDTNNIDEYNEECICICIYIYLFQKCKFVYACDFTLCSYSIKCHETIFKYYVLMTFQLKSESSTLIKLLIVSLGVSR